MRYLNIKTGAVIDSSFVISGDNWHLENEKIIQKETTAAPLSILEEQNKTIEPEAGELADITIKEIKQELDSMGINYNPKAKKQELFALMMGK